MIEIFATEKKRRFGGTGNWSARSRIPVWEWSHATKTTNHDARWNKSHPTTFSPPSTWIVLPVSQ